MIIITAKVHPLLLQTFEESALQHQYMPNITYDQLSERIGEATGLVITTRIKVDKELLSKAHQLKWIGRLGSGLELIDLKAAEERNITCISTPEGNCNAVGEMALGSLLSLLRNIHKSAEEIEEGKWLRDQNRGTEISDKTIGIIGFGHTGQAFAKVLAGFDVKLLACDKYKTGYTSGYIFEATKEEIIARANIISFHLPLTDETYHYADETFFKNLQQRPVIINMSRGKVVDTTALINALDTHLISGACLDVLENEQIQKLSQEEQSQFDALRNKKNVLLTPHIAGYSHEAYFKMSAFLIEKLKMLQLI